MEDKMLALTNTDYADAFNERCDHNDDLERLEEVREELTGNLEYLLDWKSRIAPNTGYDDRIEEIDYNIANTLRELENVDRMIASLKAAIKTQTMIIVTEQLQETFNPDSPADEFANRIYHPDVEWGQDSEKKNELPN